MGSDCIWRSSDTDAELELVCGQAKQAGAFDAVQCTNWSEGGAGALALAEAVQKAAKLPGSFRFLYDSQVRSGVVGKIVRWYIYMYAFSRHFYPKNTRYK